MSNIEIFNEALICFIGIISVGLTKITKETEILNFSSYSIITLFFFIILGNFISFIVTTIKRLKEKKKKGKRKDQDLKETQRENIQEG